MSSNFDDFLKDGESQNFVVEKKYLKKEKDSLAKVLHQTLVKTDSSQKTAKSPLNIIDKKKKKEDKNDKSFSPKRGITSVLEKSLSEASVINKVVKPNPKPKILIKKFQADQLTRRPADRIKIEDKIAETLEKTLPNIDSKPVVSKIGENQKLKFVPKKKSDINIADFLEKSLPKTEFAPEVLEVGEVAYIGDGICKVIGLANARIDDVLKVQTGNGDVLILVLGISNDLVETVVLGDYFSVKKGNLVFSTQRNLKIPAGKGVLGRIISPIGRPIDGLGDIVETKEMNVERPAPAVFMRTPIVDQLRTGFLVVDSIIPVGRGQRELVTGDRKSGKSRLMLDILCNLKEQNIFCVYVGVGAQKAKIKAMAQYLEKYGALKNTAIVMGSSDDPPSLNYLAPYAGTAIAEYFCDNGQDAFIVYDDLSKHAKAYRQMSLLLKRSPGRDAYPGDIFYLHSRLLERSSKVLPKYGGGSITAMPMCETQNGDISEYITTNLMSITDGHIYLDSQMMHDGILPAVNSGASVSRIGGSIQPKLLRKLGAIAGGQLARYNEVKSYETMNTEITEETEREINRGKRILEIFNQPSGINYTPAEETILLHVVTGGLLDYIPLDLVASLKVEIIDFYHQNITSYKDLTENSEKKDADDKDFSLFDGLITSFTEKTNTQASIALKEAWDKKYAPVEAAPVVVEEELKPVAAGSEKK